MAGCPRGQSPLSGCPEKGSNNAFFISSLVPAAFDFALTTLLAYPLSRYFAWIMDGHYRAPGWLRWIERRVDSGPQDWKQYAIAMMLFNTLMFIFGFVVLAIQPKVNFLGLNPDGKGMLAPTTIFNSVTSFLTNTNLQHYCGEQHLSYFSQIFFVCWNMFLSASVGYCGLVAIIRGLRGDAHMGNYYLDMWRVVAYQFVPLSVLMGVFLLADGVPMTMDASAKAATVEAGAMGKTPTARTSRRKSAADRSPRSFPSSTWGPTAAGSSAPIRPTPSRTPAPGATCSR